MMYTYRTALEFYIGNACELWAVGKRRDSSVQFGVLMAGTGQNVV